MGCSGQEYWSGLPFPSPGDLPDPQIEPGSSELQVESLLSEPPGKPSSFQMILQLLYHGPHLEQQGFFRNMLIQVTLFWEAPKSLQMVIAAMKLKDVYSLEEKL